MSVTNSISHFFWLKMGWKMLASKSWHFLSHFNPDNGNVVSMVYSFCVCGFVCVCVCLCVHALKGKRPELSTPNLVHIYSMAEAWHALTQRSRSRWYGYENHHDFMVANEVCSCFCVLRLSVWNCMSFDCLYSNYFKFDIQIDASSALMLLVGWQEVSK